MNAIEVQDVSKRFRLYTDRPGSLKQLFTKFGLPKYDDFWAVRNVTLDVENASVSGLIGHNGCGKSTLLRMMAGIHFPTSGTVATKGRISALLELGAGFHPELTGRENVYLNASILGLSRKQTDLIFDRIVDFSGLSAFIDSPVKHYSSGMYVRLGFSVAVHVDPQILLVDEVIAVGDEDFQRRCLDHLAGLKASGVTIVLVSHNLGVIGDLCDQVTWMDHGVVREIGEPTWVISQYLQEVNAAESERLRLEAEAAGFVPAPAKPTESEMVDDSGTAIEFGITGQPVNLRIALPDHLASEEHTYSLLIQTESGVVVGETELSMPLARSGPFPNGYTIRCRFDPLLLGPGVYEGRVRVLGGETHRGEAMRDLSFPFRVRAESSVPGGMLRLPATWLEDNGQ
ncbi:MAG: polysaccharide ABC transporter ATP-binding protein [Actinobacteria bacterium]|nr:polysaccharide ABC transporter ATP-binding protein [Actinomycetota bacterium]